MRAFPELPIEWAGVDLDLSMSVAVVFAKSTLDILLDPAVLLKRVGEPTDEERAAGCAKRLLVLDEDECWEFSTCSLCGLPLTLHGPKRKDDPRRKWCRRAREMAKQ